MKKSYVKLIIINFLTILFCLFNSFYFKKINSLFLTFFLIILLLITKILFGFEKDKHRYIKDVCLKIVINLFIFLIFYYLVGIFIGFAKTYNFSSLKAIINIIFYIVIKEYLRYTLITKSSESKFLLILTTIMFIFIDNTIAFSINGFLFNKSTFLLVAITFIPSITENILCSWMSFKFGFKPVMLYLLIIKLYLYILPIIPNPNEYIYSIIFFLLPIMILFNIKKWLDKGDLNIVLNKANIIPYFLIVFSLILIYFVSGYFRYYAIAIASGSMNPIIKKGDVVIVDQKFKNLKKGDIIAYRYNGTVIVHRINDLIRDKNDIIIYTKGDSNSSCDSWKVEYDMIIGVINYKIPLIGYPTVWINNYW